MKFAYADPPYPGQAKRWYRDHPDYAGEVDHGELISRMCRDYPDGWALSTNVVSLQFVLGLCPEDVRTAVWHKTNEAPPRRGWWFNWEPVIVRGGLPRPVRTVFSSGQNGRQGRFPRFQASRLRLLDAATAGSEVEDVIDDLFPGSGIVGREIEAWRTQCSVGHVRRKAVSNNLGASQAWPHGSGSAECWSAWAARHLIPAVSGW